MNRTFRVAITAVTVGVCVLAGAGVAHADTGKMTADSVARDVARVAPDATVVPMAIEGGPERVSDGESTAPAAANGVVEAPSSTGADMLTIGLPSSTPSEAVTASDGTVVYAAADVATDVAVQSLGSGVRVQTVLRGQSAPTRFVYTLPDFVEPTIEDDGSVFLASTSASTDAAQVAAGIIDAPWAVDAAGEPVATHYEIADGNLVQVVDHHQVGVTYPVVADPNVSYCTLGGFYPAQCVKFTKAETKWAAQQYAAGVGAGTVAAHMCGKIPGAVGLGCKVAAAVTIAAGIKSFADAAKKGKCVAVTFSYPFVAQLAAGGLRVVKC